MKRKIANNISSIKFSNIIVQHIYHSLFIYLWLHKIYLYCLLNGPSILKTPRLTLFKYSYDLLSNEVSVYGHNKGNLIPFLVWRKPSENFSLSSMHGYFTQRTTWNPFFSVREPFLQSRNFLSVNISYTEGCLFAICSRFHGILFPCHFIMAYCTDYNLLKLRVFGFPRVLAILNLV